MLITIAAPDEATSTMFTLTAEQVTFLRRQYGENETIPLALRDIIEFWLETNMGTYFGATVVDIDNQNKEEAP